MSLLRSCAPSLRASRRSFHLSAVLGSGSANAAKAKPAPTTEDDPLPLLNRPLGVVQRPTTRIRTRTEKLQEYMNQDAIIEERRHIIKEATKGYFDDLNNTRRHGGKTWIAPQTLIREDKALYLPNISGTPLVGKKAVNTTTMCAGRITVLAMLGTKISEIHAKGFVDPTYEHYGTHPSFQYIQVNLQENLLKSILVNLFTKSLRSTVPPELHPYYLVSSQNMEYVRDAIGMTNSKVGYVYLIDENLKIRWGGCADAMLEETQALETCTGVLIKRLDKLKPPGTRPRT
ncbi:ATPase assembly factor ATP10 [Pleurotus pulmonarius]|nr:Mitochondrial ATPase complex subunit atp10 [Pleurotus pulmonarius]